METITNTLGEGTTDGAPVLRIARERLHRLTRELARQDGRDPAHVSQADYEQARCDLTGEWDRERQEAKLEPILEEDDEADGSGGSTPASVASGCD